jgi:uncharacterized membrane protein
LAVYQSLSGEVPMIPSAVLWPALLGVVFLVVGMIAYGRDFHAGSSRTAFGLVVFGPVFVGAALAAFAGEHFTAASTIAQLVPKWMPGRLFIAYFVGVAHLAAATSFIARRYVRWSSLCLAVMFALFVLLMDLPGALRNPTVRMSWSLAARQATFALGALALFVTATRGGGSAPPKIVTAVIRLWTGGVLVFYGIEHFIRPDFSPGVPATMPTASWVPLPLALAYATGVLLIAFGIALFSGKHAAAGAAWAGLLMTVLTAVLYVPQFFLAADTGARVTAINFIFDTLLFAGMMLVISAALSDPLTPRVDASGIPVRGGALPQDRMAQRV